MSSSRHRTVHHDYANKVMASMIRDETPQPLPGSAAPIVIGPETITPGTLDAAQYGAGSLIARIIVHGDYGTSSTTIVVEPSITGWRPRPAFEVIAQEVARVLTVNPDEQVGDMYVIELSDAAADRITTAALPGSRPNLDQP